MLQIISHVHIVTQSLIKWSDLNFTKKSWSLIFWITVNAFIIMTNSLYQVDGYKGFVLTMRINLGGWMRKSSICIVIN